jgi:hypothetical protein
MAAEYDYFPIEGTRRTVDRCRRFWKMLGHPSDLELFEETCRHQYTAGMVRALNAFFSKHLLGKEPVARHAPVSTFAGTELRCTKSGQVRGELAGTRFVHEANLERLRETMSLRTARGNRRELALAWLKQRVQAHRKPCPINPRSIFDSMVGGLAVESLMWWSQEGIFNHGLLFRNPKPRNRQAAAAGVADHLVPLLFPNPESAERQPVTLAIWDGGTTALRPHWGWIRTQCRRGRSVLVLDVSGTGAIAPNALNARPLQNPFGTIHKLADDLAWLDDDLAALRTFDVLRALDVIGEWPGLGSADIRVYAQGKHGIYGQLAAALDARAQRIEVHGGIGSFSRLVRSRNYDPTDGKSVVLHGVLRYFDLDELPRWKRRGR